MSSTPYNRGWGAVGKPGSATGIAYRKANIVKIVAGGITLYVHKGVAPIFKSFCDEIVRRGYPLNVRADDWGYNHRYIAGTYTLSNHSWGLAIDLNAITNPQGNPLHTDMPAWVIECAQRHGLDWGGWYTTARKDPMHFEFLGTPAEAAAIIARLASTPATPTHEEEPMQARQIPKTGLLPNGRAIFMNVTPEGRAVVYNDVSALDGHSDVHKGDCITRGIPNAGIIGWDFLTRTADGTFYGYVMFAADGGTFIFQ